MDKMHINYKSLIINNIVGSIAFLKAKIVNIHFFSYYSYKALFRRANTCPLVN